MALGLPFAVPYPAAGGESDVSNKVKPASYGKGGVLIKDPGVYEAVLAHFAASFTEDAKSAIVDDLAAIFDPTSPQGRNRALALKEMSTSPELVRAVFGLAELADAPGLRAVHLGLLLHFMSLGKQNVWRLVKGGPGYQLSLINDMLAHELGAPSEERGSPGFVLRAFQMLASMEDVFLREPALASSSEFRQTLARFLLLFHKSDLMYVSLPWISLFDERTLLSLEKERGLLLQWDELEAVGDGSLLREGGATRILLKLLLFYAKLDSDKDLRSCDLLRFYLFRDRGSKKAVKQLAFLQHTRVDRPKQKHKRIMYNLVDLMLGSDAERMKRHNQVCDWVLKKALANEASVFDSHKLTKTSQAVGKEKCMFEQGPVLAAMVCGQLFQIIHFDFLGVQSYQEMGKAERKVGPRPTFADQGSKTQRIAEILGDIIRYPSKGGAQMTDVLGEEFIKIVESVGKTRAAGFFLQKSELKLGSVYTVLDTLTVTRRTSCPPPENERISERLPHEKGIVAAVMTPRAGGSSSFKAVSSKPQQELLGRFCHDEWIKFVQMLAVTTPDEITRVLLSPREFELIQPCLHFMTTHSLNMVDYIVTKKLMPRRASQPMKRSDRQDFLKFMGDFRERIRDRFCYISIHAEKIGTLQIFTTSLERDEAREEFDTLAQVAYKRLKREQECEVGAWFDRRKDRDYRETFRFVRTVYDKSMLRLTAPRRRSDAGMPRPERDEFVTLDVSRDRLERAMKLRRMRKVEEIDSLGCHLSYLRRFVCKKLIVGWISGNSVEARSNIGRDMDREVVRNVFVSSTRKRSDTSQSAEEEKAARTLRLEKLGGSFRVNAGQTATLLTQKRMSLSQPQWNEFIPKSTSRLCNHDPSRDQEIRRRNDHHPRRRLRQALRQHSVHLLQERGPQTREEIHAGGGTADSAGKEGEQEVEAGNGARGGGEAVQHGAPGG